MAIRTIIITATRSGTPATIVINRGPTGPAGEQGEPGEGASYLEDVEAAETVVSPGDTDRWGWIQTVVGVPTLRKITGLGLKNWLKAYFDTLYAAAGSYLTSLTTATPTNLTGILKGNGTDLDVGVAGVDYLESISDGSITLAKQANLAAATVIGRALGAGTGVPTALTPTQLRALQVMATTDEVTFAKVISGDQLWAGAGSLRVAPAGINFGGYHPLTWYTGGAYAAIGLRLHAALDQLEINNGTTGQYRDFLLRDCIASRYLRPASYTVAAANALSSPPTGAIIYISNESGGACPAYYRGGWLRISDNAAIS